MKPKRSSRVSSTALATPRCPASGRRSIDETAPLPEEGSEHTVYRVTIDGVSVKFTEESWAAKAIVEGRLSDTRLLLVLIQSRISALNRNESLADLLS